MSVCVLCVYMHIGGQLSACNYHTTKATVQSCFCLQICRSVFRGDPVYHNLPPDRKLCSVFFFFCLHCFYLPDCHRTTSPGQSGGLYLCSEIGWSSSLLHRHLESLCVCLEPPRSGQDLPFARLSFVNKKVFLIDRPG